MHTFPLIARLAALAGLAAFTSLGAPAPAAATTLTLFGDQSITISGSDNAFCGVAHSNGNVRITGTDNAVSGIFEYAGIFHATDHNATNAVKTASAPLPAPAHDLAYYRTLAQAQGTYFPGNADLGPISGVIFAEGDIHFSGSDTTGAVTFVSAGGEIHLSGSHNALAPAVDGVLFFTATGDGDITGSNSSYDGGMYAPAGDIARHGADDSNVSGPVVAHTISWSGSRNHLGGECCAAAADCHPDTACDTPSCAADGTCAYTKVGGCIPCATDADCADTNPCTADTCANGRCASRPVADGTPCGDSDPCNGEDTCRAGVCTTGPVPRCDDQNACTTDRCDPHDGCGYTLLDCDDHDAGTADSCDPTSGCQHPPIDCDDHNPCTTDTRDPVAGCVHTNVANGTPCGDGNACNGDETCRAGVCGFNPPPSCDDGNACTTDACSTRSGGCIHSRIPGCIPCTTAADCPAAGQCATAVCGAGVCATAPADHCPACAPEVCDDGTDNDCDGLTDCADPDCAAVPACVPPKEICGDCKDNDGDGLVDAEDPDCCAQPLAFGPKFVQLRPLSRKGDRLRLMGIFAPTKPAGFDPLTKDTSLQITDENGALFCTTIASIHWMPMGKRTIAFWDKQGTFSDGLSDGRFKVQRDGSILFRTHGQRATLRTPMARRVQIIVRVGAQCSATTTALRPTKTGLALP